jgi:hypothetical protein
MVAPAAPRNRPYCMPTAEAHVSLDDVIRSEADRALALRFCRLLLLSPLVTVPLTILLGAPWLDSSIPLESHTPGDVVLVHLPGLVNAYPAWHLARRGRVGRLPLMIAILGLFAYLVPNVFWLLTLHSWRQVPPLANEPIFSMTVAISGTNSLVLWALILTWYRSLLGDEHR